MDKQANQSEIAALRGRIHAQNQAARWAITGLAAGTAQHRFITARFKKMEEYHSQLAELVGEQEATNMLVEIFDEKGETGMPERRARYELSLRTQPEPPNLHTLHPCLYELGDHVLEIVEEEWAMIANRTQLDETVTLQKDELYYLLVVLQELFAHDTL